MPSNHLLCRPLLLLPSVFPSIRVFSNELAVCIRRPNIRVSASASAVAIAVPNLDLLRIWSSSMASRTEASSTHLVERVSYKLLHVGCYCWWNGASKVALCQCRRHKRHGFSPWVGKIPWLPTPVFLPGESHGQRSLAGYSP